MRALVQSFLLIAITLAYVVGPCVAIEYHHSHDAHQDHQHLHVHPHGAPSDHHPDVPSPDSEDCEEDSDPLSHSHVVSLGADSPITTPDVPLILFEDHSANNRLLPDAESCPEGPFFAVIKPPQLV